MRVAREGEAAVKDGKVGVHPEAIAIACRS